MARKSRTAVLKRQRELKKAEKAAAQAREARDAREASRRRAVRGHRGRAGGLRLPVEDEERTAVVGASRERRQHAPSSHWSGVADEPLIAVFVDYENLAIGVRQMRKGTFQIELVLRRLLEKGRIVYKRAYCDWGNYRDAVREFHTQGIELIDIPQSKASGKNSADIHMVVDALDLCHQKDHIDVVRAGLGRQRLLAARREAQGERQARDRLRREELDLRSADRQLRRVHLLRRPDPRGRAEEAEAGRAAQEGGSRGRATRGRSARRWSRACARSSATTTRSGARCSSRRSAASTRASTRATTARRSFAEMLEMAREGGPASSSSTTRAAATTSCARSGGVARGIRARAAQQRELEPEA